MIYKHTHYLLLAFITINIILRYPLVPHEIGSDSFYVHMLTNSVLSYGNIQWYLDTFSLFGAFPFSYPAGVPSFLGSLSIVTNIRIELAIIIMNISFGLLSFLGMFLFASKFFNPTNSLILSLLYSTSQGNLEFTTWSAVARSFYICFIPIFLFMLHSVIRYQDILKRNLIDLRFTVLVVILGITLLSTHRISYSVLICVISFVLAFLFILIRNYFNIKVRKLYSNAIFLILLSIFFSYYFLPISGNGARTFLDSEEHSKGPLHWFVMVIVANVRSSGPLITFCPYWSPSSYTKPRKGFYITFYFIFF